MGARKWVKGNTEGLKVKKKKAEKQKMEADWDK